MSQSDICFVQRPIVKRGVDVCPGYDAKLPRGSGRV